MGSVFVCLSMSVIFHYV